MHNSGDSEVHGRWSCPLHCGDPYHGEAPLVQAGKPLQPLPTVCLVFPALLSAPSPSLPSSPPPQPETAVMKITRLVTDCTSSPSRASRQRLLGGWPGGHTGARAWLPGFSSQRPQRLAGQQPKSFPSSQPGHKHSPCLSSRKARGLWGG